MSVPFTPHRLFATLLGLLVVAPPAFPTAFVVIKTRAGWVVAADSRRISPSSHGGLSKIGQSCKIRQNGRITLIVWGPEWEQGDIQDLRQRSQSYLDKPNGTAQNRSADLYQSIKSDRKFLSTIDRYIQGVSRTFGWAFVDGSGAYGYERDLNGKFEKVDYSNESRILFGAYAVKTASLPYLRAHISHGQLPSVTNARSLAQEALKAEAAVSSSVGGPFSSVLVSSSRVEWLDQNDDCRSLVFENQ